MGLEFSGIGIAFAYWRPGMIPRTKKIGPKFWASFVLYSINKVLVSQQYHVEITIVAALNNMTGSLLCVAHMRLID